jgi:hypothetical protein
MDETLQQYMTYTMAHCKYARTGERAYRYCCNLDPNCGCGHHAQSCELNRCLYHFLEYPLMARKKKSNQSTFTPIEFIRFELTADDKKDLLKWCDKERENFDLLCTEVVQTGHKMSMSFNDQNDSFICSVTGKPEECDNASRCYTSHGKSWAVAQWVALYKFHVIWKKGVWESVDDASDFG